MKFQKLTSFRPLILFLHVALLSLISTSVYSQVTTLDSWSVNQGSNSSNSQSYSISSGTGANRILIVGIVETRTSSTTTSETVTYGGQTLTLVKGDLTTSLYQHTALYYLDESGIEAASGTTLSVNINSNTSSIVNTMVFAGTYDNVDQTTPITDSQNYNSGNSTTNSFSFSTALTVNAYDQAIVLAGAFLSSSSNAPTITFGTNWTSQIPTQYTYRSRGTKRSSTNDIGNRSQPTSNTTDNAATTLNTYAYVSMTGLSLKAAPFINVSTSSLSGFSYSEGYGPSSEQSFTVSGANLTSNITVTAPTDYEISKTSGSGFAVNLYNISLSSTTTIYVRLKSGLTQGNYNSENITASSTGATTKTITCDGTVDPPATITLSDSTINGMGYAFGGSSSEVSFTVSGSNLVGNVVITPPSDFEISTSSGSESSSAITLTPSGGTLSSTTIYVILKAGLGVNSYNQNIVVSTTDATSQNVAASGSVTPIATITKSETSLYGFIYQSGYGPSGEMSFTLHGKDLGTDNVNVTLNSPASTYFEVSSTSGGTFGSTLSFPPSGGTVDTTVYVRMKAGLSTGLYGPYDISLTSSGAVTKSIACKGYVASSAYLLTSTSSVTGFGYQYSSDTIYSGIEDGGPSEEQFVYISGAALSNDITVTPPTDFEISTTSGSGFQSTPITLTKGGSDNRVNPTKIYIRLKKGLGVGDYTENLSITSSGASSESVTCVGKVYAAPLIAASGGGSYCVGNTIKLTSSGVDVTGIYWEGPNSFYAVSQDTTVTTSAAKSDAGDYIVTGNVVVGGNLIFNGDFSLGNFGFGSNYTAVDSAYNALWPEGDYCVVTDPNSVHQNFSACPDHTTGTGRQMVVNGSGTAGVVIWSQSVAVIPGADYQFTYWVQSVTPTYPSILQLYVNGVAAGPQYTAESTTCNWIEFLYNANAGSNSILNLELINQNTALGGNDFSLDDIEFKQVLYAKDTATVDVSTNFPVSVSISASNNPVYSETPVTFTATPTNGGTSPTYQWYVNSSAVAGATSSTYNYTPSNGDVIECVLTSSLSCTTGNPATSNQITMTVNPRNNYWVGTNSTDWGTASNWSAGTIPNAGDDIVFADGTNYSPAAQNDLYLDQDRTIGNLVDNSSKALVIPAAKSLTVNSVVTTNKDPNQILIKSDGTDAPGSLIFGNRDVNDSVYATVYYYSKAYTDSTGGGNDIFHWQYFGIPVTSIVAHPSFDGAYVRKWDETGDAITNHWVAQANDSVLQPFYGYEICQDNPALFKVQGILENKDFNSGQLAVTASALYPGQHIFANPYTAAINIKYLTFGSETESTVYLYNTGTFQNWVDSLGQDTYDSLTSIPGQYTAIPKNVAGTGSVQGEIPSQQGFLIKAMTASPYATFSISYNSVITKNTTLRRAPSANNAITDTIPYVKFDLKTTRVDDHLWLFRNKVCKPTFDNGWDGTKIFNFDSSVPQLFAIEPDGYYQVSTTNNLNNISIGFRPGSESTYTLSMTCNNYKSIYQGIYLIDLTENKIIELNEGQTTEYTFTTDQHTNIENRFKVVTQYYEKNATGTNTKVDVFNTGKTIIVKNESAIRGDVYVYDMFGRLMLIKQADASSLTTIHADNLTPGAYIVKVTTNDSELNKRIILQ